MCLFVLNRGDILQSPVDPLEDPKDASADNPGQVGGSARMIVGHRTP